ncbi:oligosaccharide flippase family protein [Paenibacillus sp. NEAU-GSW1]|uniref:oligosaccharide flippase family protein n=1 Tax=Paenibacillus sp. NEAU-GSW1 TaxID=2682486 RepID=UPI001563D8BD|nr:oligosaccharide flippase family protein [Paenibacillus sp. NEAU-GSW1]
MAVMQIIRRNDSLGHIARIFASNVFILVLSTLTGIMIARFLGPVGRGEQAVMIMWPQVLSCLVTLGLPSSVIYCIKKNESDQASLYFSAIAIGAVIGSLAVVAGLFVIPSRMEEYSPAVIEFAKWALIVTPFSLLGLVNNAALQARDEFTLFNTVRYVPNIMTLLFLSILVFTNHVNPFLTSLAYLTPQIPVTLWLIVRMSVIYRANWKVNAQSIRTLAGYGVRSYGTDLAGTMSYYIDQIIVVSLLMPQSLGLYVVALSLSKILNTVQVSVVSVFFPEASRLEKQSAIEYTLKVFRLTSIITLALALLALLLSPYALPLLYGASFAKAVPVLEILLLQVVIASGADTLSQGYMAIGKPGRITLLQFGTLAANAALLLLLVPLMEIEGAAISLLLSTVLKLAALIWMYKREHSIGFNRYIPSKSEVSGLWKKAIRSRTTKEHERYAEAD